MAIVACPACAAQYNLKDEFMGRRLKCTKCGDAFDAVPSAGIAPQAQADPIFDRDRFFMRQKVMTINQKYAVSDESGRPLIFVIRRTYLLMGLLAALAGIAALVAVAGVVIAGGVFAVFGGNPPKGDTEGALFATLVIIGVVLGIVACIAVAVSIYPKRHVEFYADETYTRPLLDVQQDSKWQIINATYTLRDAQGTPLARLHKNFLYNFFRKRWNVRAIENDALICRAFEDSIILSLLRRVIGGLIGNLIRTNFIITSGESDQVIGEFNRKFTIVDKYVLDLAADPTRQLDRRIAVGLGVMLDTGERR